MLRSPFKIEGIREKKQLLPSILEQLEDLIFLNESNHRKSLALDIACPNNYYIWEEQARENVDIKKDTRHDRFARLINSTIKQLISIFVAMVALQYPAEKVQIVSRWVP